MTDQETVITTDSEPPPFTWQSLLDMIKAPRPNYACFKWARP